MSFMCSILTIVLTIGTSLSVKAFSMPEIQKAFEIAQSISFYSYGDIDNFPYESTSFPFCSASAAVIGDQLQIHFKKPVKQVDIYFRSTYDNYCKYPTAYGSGYHTFVALPSEDGDIYAIDPAHVKKPLKLRDYIKEYMRKDCQLTSLVEVEKIAEESGMKGVYYENVNNRGENISYDLLTNYRKTSLEKMISKKLKPFPKKINGYFFDSSMVGFGDSTEELGFLRDNLADQHFLYVYILDSLIKSGSMSSVTFARSNDFWKDAYSWVIPNSVDVKETIYSHDSKEPFQLRTSLITESI